MRYSAGIVPFFILSDCCCISERHRSLDMAGQEHLQAGGSYYWPLQVKWLPRSIALPLETPGLHHRCVNPGGLGCRSRIPSMSPLPPPSHASSSDSQVPAIFSLIGAVLKPKAPAPTLHSISKILKLCIRLLERFYRLPLCM